MTGGNGIAEAQAIGRHKPCVDFQYARVEYWGRGSLIEREIKHFGTGVWRQGVDGVAERDKPEDQVFPGNMRQSEPLCPQSLDLDRLSGRGNDPLRHIAFELECQYRILCISASDHR